MPRKTAVTKQRISMFSSLKQKFSNNRNFDNLFSDSSEETFDINKKGRNGKTLLHDACEHNDLETVKLLVTGEGLDLDVADNDGYAPLHYLCKKAFLECLECIIDHSKSANIDELFQKTRRSGIFTTIPSALSVKDESGKVVLHHACDKGRAHLVDRLLAFHADPNAQDNARCTPLHYACRSENTDIIKELIHTYKANLNIPCDSSGTVVHYACKERKLELLQMLLSCNPDLSVVHRNSRTTLHLACESGFVEGIGELLARDSCCTAEDASGFTPMYYACQYSHVQCVEYLIEKSQQGVSLLTPAVLAARNTLSDKGILHCACEVGNAKVVKWLIEAGADLSVKDKENITPLHLACVNHHWNCIDSLLDYCIMKGTEGEQILLPILRFVNVKKDESILKYLFGMNDIALMDERGRKLLLYAIEDNLWSCVKDIVQCCISSVPKDQCKSFLGLIVPYTWKCATYSILDKLIDLDINLAVRDTDGYTLLHNLCKYGKLDLLSHTMKRVHFTKVKELLKETASGVVPLALKDNSGRVILHHACISSTGEIVEMLLSFDCNANVRDEEHCTPLYYACRRGHIGIVTKLISKGANCNAICDSCGTPLHLACSQKNVKLVQLLTSAAGINLNVLDHNGESPLHIACRNGAADVVDHLCKVGANCMLKDKQGSTPIHCACAGNHWQCVLHLIGSLKNMHDSKVKLLLEFTLFSAIKCASGLSVVKKLCEVGFDFRIHDTHGYTPLYYACVGIHLDATEYLLLHLPEEHIHELTNTGKGCNPLTIADSEGKVILHHASEKGRSKLVERIPTFGGNRNMKDKQQRTPLHYACMNGHDATVHALICKDPNLAAVKDALGCTPMHYACKNAHVSCVQSLIDIIPQYQNLLKMSTGMMWGVTPLAIQHDRTLKVILHHACEKGVKKLVEVLLKAGADPFAPNSTQTTPFHYACRYGHWDCVEALLDHCIKIKVALPESAKSFLVLALEKGALFVACKLLRAGCKLESIESRTAHQTACKNYDWSKVHRLIDHCIETLSRNNAPFFLNPFLPCACERGDLFIVTWLIGIGCDVVNSEVQAALRSACENGHLECVEFIADHCIAMMDRSEVNQLLNTVLSLACSRIRIMDRSKVKQFLHSVLSLAYNRSIRDSERLIGMGDADILASRGITLILSAYEHGHWQCVEHVVGYCIGAMDKNTILRILSPILPYVCKDGRVGLFIKLVDFGAPLTEQDTNGYTCLHYLCKNGHLSGLEYLIEKYHQNPSCIHNLFQLHSWYYFGATPLTIKDESGKVILHHACQGGSEQLVQFLLSFGASPNVCDQNALTPLHTACQHGAAEVIDALVAAGANCSAQDTVGLTPLHYACRNGHLQCVKYLLGERQQRRYLLRKYSKLFSGYSPITIKEDVSGKVVLHHACEQGDFELVKILVGAGASISVYDLNHCTPLHYAFMNNHSQSRNTAEYLVNYYQETKNKSDTEEFLCRFLDLACKKGSCCVIHSLVNCDWKLSVDDINRSPLLCAAENDNWNCVNLLVDHCTACRESGTMSEAEQEQLLDPILPLACKKNDVTIIEKLLGENEGEVIGERGLKLLHIACKNGHWLCVETLLDFYKRKSCVSAKFSALLNDVLSSACKSEKLDVNMMEKLVEVGADFSIEDANKFTPLHYLCRNAHILCLEYLLGLEDSKTSRKLAWILKSDFTPLSVKDNLGKVVLHHACEKGNVHLVKRLLEHGADPGVLDDMHCTPLHYACWKEDMGIIEELLAKKPDLVNVACDASGTPLQDACAKGNVRLVQVLVSTHADLNVSDSDGCTPLHIACRGGFIDVVERLVSAHANCRAKDNYGQIPMHSACKNGHLLCVEALIRSPNGQSLLKVPATPVSNDTPLTVHNTSGKMLLHYACEQGKIEIVRMAIEEGADPTVEDSSHFTPLHYACENNHTLCAKHTIDHCRNSKDLLSQLLPFVSQKRNILLVKKLLSMGAHCTVEDAKGKSALHYACENNDVVCAECLIQHCQKVLKPDELKEYLSKHLLTAIVGDHVGVVEKLIQAGADIAVQDGNGDTAVYFAYRKNYRQSASEMIDSCLKSPTKDQAKLILNPILPLASMKGDIITVRKLCELQIDVKEKDELGNTPLHYACKNSHLKCVQAILNTQQSRKEQLTILQIPNKGRRTPLDIDTDGRVILHKACEQGIVELVKTLLEAGASRQAQIKASGLTPVHLACLNGHIACLEAILNEQSKTEIYVLLQLGSDRKSGIPPLAVKDHYGRTILHHACNNNCVDLVKDLISAGADPCVQDSQLYTPLMYACVGHSFLCAEYLVNNTSQPFGRLINFEVCGVSPMVLTDLKDSNARTVLHYVCKTGKVAVVKELISIGANATAEDVDGSTPLHMACQHGHVKCVQYLLSLPQFQITYSPKYSAELSIARDVIISALSMPDDSGKVVLHHACKEGNVEMIEKLLTLGAPTAKAVDSEGYTPLHYACQGGHVSIVQVFPDLSNLLKIKGSNGYTPLHCACESGQLECVEYLIDNHWDLMISQAAESPSPLIVKRGHGPNVFQFACQSNEAKLVAKLSKFIIDPDVEDSDGYTFPMHLAMNPIDKTVLYSILQPFKEAEWTIDAEHRKTKKTALHLACESGNIDCVEFLLSNGADLSLKDCDERTPLLAACANFKHFTASQPESVLLSLIRLLTIGEGHDRCNINAQDTKEGKTALHYSAECHDHYIPLALLDAGADIDCLDGKGQTFFKLSPPPLFAKVKSNLLQMKRHKIVCVVGYPKCGKSTLIAAIEEAQQIQGTLNEWSCELFRREVNFDDERTAGIITKVVNCKSLGSIRFFDFAGHTEYYISHLAFLDSALSVKDVSVAFIMMTDLRKPKMERLAECKEWLCQIKCIISDNNNSQLKVILVGSHLDTFYFWQRSHQTVLLKEMFDHLKATFFDCKQMHFKGFVTMNCRRLISNGSRDLQGYLASGYQSGSSFEDISPSACVLFNNLKGVKQVLSLVEVKEMHDKNSSSPSTLVDVGNLCKQLAASGLILYIEGNDSDNRWVVVQVEDILSDVHGTLFAPPDKQKFPKYKSCLDNKFGLITLTELELGFKECKLPLQMIKDFLMIMQFCYPLPAKFLHDDILKLLYDGPSGQECLQWLYFPHLVKAKEFDVPDLFPNKQSNDHWICWELQVLDSDNHRFNPLLQQALFITFGAKFVDRQYTNKFKVNDHSCVLLRNGIKWSNDGVDICVRVKEKSAIWVLGRSTNEKGFKPLIDMISKVVQEVFRVQKQKEFCHSYPPDTTSCFREVVDGHPSKTCSLLTPSVVCSLRRNSLHVSCTCDTKHSCSLSDFFGIKSRSHTWSMLKDTVLESLERMIPDLECSDIRHPPIECSPVANEPGEFLCMPFNMFNVRSTVHTMLLTSSTK